MPHLTIVPKANPTNLPPRSMEQHLAEISAHSFNDLEGFDEDCDELDGQIVSDDAADQAFLDAMESVRTCGLLS